MLNKYGVMSAALGLVLSLSSCSLETYDDPIIVPLIDQEFQLDLWQNLGEATPSNLEIRMSTIEEEDCLNTRILSTYERTGRVMNITLYDILEPEVCDPGSAPARGEEQVTDLSPNDYGIKIELQNIVSNDGTLTVTEEAYLIDMTEESGISWLHKTIYRIPENVLWGYVAYSNAAEEARVATFVEELRELGEPLTLREGYYGHFTVNSGGNTIKIANAPSADSAKSIFLNFSASSDAIEQRVTEFLSNTGNEQIELRILDGRGNQWSN